MAEAATVGCSVYRWCWPSKGTSSKLSGSAHGGTQSFIAKDRLSFTRCATVRMKPVRVPKKVNGLSTGSREGRHRRKHERCNREEKPKKKIKVIRCHVSLASNISALHCSTVANVASGQWTSLGLKTTKALPESLSPRAFHFRRMEEAKMRCLHAGGDLPYTSKFSAEHLRLLRPISLRE